jgi:transcriptional regulator with XRE-family HTH domain
MRLKKNQLLNRFQEVNIMTKPLTKEQIQLKKYRRLKDKSLENLLMHRFLNQYGYDKGEITAQAIIQDILKLIEDYFLVSSLDDDQHHIHSGQIVYMAVPLNEYPKRGKAIAQTKLKPVVLSYVADEDIEHIAHGFDSKTLRIKRLIRWVDQAYDQGALLTQLDLAMLLGVSEAAVSQYVNEIQNQGRLLPTRGNIHDLSGAITHKREIITLFLEGYFTPEISIKTKHSNESVDRYIKDYLRVKLLWENQITNLNQICQLTRLSKRVVQQYVDLLPEKFKKAMSKNNEQKNLDFQTKNYLVNKENNTPIVI